MNYTTITDAAAKLGCHKSSVSRAVAKHGLGTRIGTVVVLTEAEIKQLKKLMPGKVGNPNFGAQPPKKSGKNRGKKKP